MKEDKTNRIKNNRLIAQFMGYEYHPFNECNKSIPDYDPPGWRHKAFKHLKIGGYLCRTHKALRYYKDWNWLMPVVEKINNTGRFEVVIMYGHCHITDGEDELTLSVQGKNTMEAVYKAVIEFIKWYNNNRECFNCEGTGEVYFSCCGDDIRHQLPENDLCPTCKEHCGDEPEKCEECNGTGKENL